MTVCAKMFSPTVETWLGWAPAGAFASFEFRVSKIANRKSPITNRQTRLATSTAHEVD
jgi:hypothetical protein